MTKRNLVLLVLALSMIGSTAGVLLQLRANQRLGPPGVKTSPIAGSIRLKVDLPERVLDYTSEWKEPDGLTLKILPKDTSFGQRLYKAPDGFEISVNVVLMGADRTSLHKPQICLSGDGWHLDGYAAAESTVQIDGPSRWDLPVSTLMGSRELTVGGRTLPVRGVYTYWFAAENEYTARHWERMWWMARDLLRTGVLQRWAYISCFSICPPGEEGQVLERQKAFIAAAVPEFQRAGGSARLSKTDAPGSAGPTGLSSSHFGGFVVFGVHPLGCLWPPNTLKRAHQTGSRLQNENCWTGL